MKTVLYPGSFDPFTNGHFDLVSRAALLFDRVIIAVAVNAGKSPMFTLEERRQLIEKCCADLPGVEVAPLSDDGGYCIEACSVVYSGVCPDCRKKHV